MRGSIMCNHIGDRVSLDKCKTCTYGGMVPGWGTTRCRYREGREPEREILNIKPAEQDITALFRRAAWLEERMNREYRRGHEKVGDTIADELGRVQREIRKLKENGGI